MIYLVWNLFNNSWSHKPSLPKPKGMDRLLSTTFQGPYFWNVTRCVPSMILDWWCRNPAISAVGWLVVPPIIFRVFFLGISGGESPRFPPKSRLVYTLLDPLSVGRFCWVKALHLKTHPFLPPSFWDPWVEAKGPDALEKALSSKCISRLRPRPWRGQQIRVEQNPFLIFFGWESGRAWMADCKS